ncbi:type II secretion system F family protein [Desulfobacterales bacterium HSG16]|nr:type II secretion system F family protein [Desulfobacterales bacterium HSG16]
MKRKTLTGLEKQFFYHQLLTLVRSNIPLECVAGIAADKTSSILPDIFAMMSSELESGNSLSDFLEKHPEYFSSYESDIVKAGEKSNNMKHALKQLAKFGARKTENRSISSIHMIYLVVTIILALAILAMISFYVLPVFKKMHSSLSSFGGSLPGLTQLAFMIGDWKFLLTIFAIGILLYAGLYLKYPEFFSMVISITPILGPRWVYRECAGFCSLFGRALESGVAPLKALENSADFVSHQYLKKRLKNSGTYLAEHGHTWATVLEKIRFFPKPLISLIHLGEKYGEMGAALIEIERSEKDMGVDRQAIMEIFPLFIIGGVIAFVTFMVIAMYLPMFIMTGAV